MNFSHFFKNILISFSRGSFFFLIKYKLILLNSLFLFNNKHNLFNDSNFLKFKKLESLKSAISDFENLEFPNENQLGYHFINKKMTKYSPFELTQKFKFIYFKKKNSFFFLSDWVPPKNKLKSIQKYTLKTLILDLFDLIKNFNINDKIISYQNCYNIINKNKLLFGLIQIKFIHFIWNCFLPIFYLNSSFEIRIQIILHFYTVLIVLLNLFFAKIFFLKNILAKNKFNKIALENKINFFKYFIQVWSIDSPLNFKQKLKFHHNYFKLKKLTKIINQRIYLNFYYKTIFLIHKEYFFIWKAKFFSFKINYYLIIYLLLHILFLLTTNLILDNKLIYTYFFYFFFINLFPDFIFTNIILLDCALILEYQILINYFFKIPEIIYQISEWNFLYKIYRLMNFFYIFGIDQTFVNKIEKIDQIIKHQQ